MVGVTGSIPVVPTIRRVPEWHCAYAIKNAGNTIVTAFA